MTRSNGPYGQAPNWRQQSRASQDQAAGDQHYDPHQHPNQDYDPYYQQTQAPQSGYGQPQYAQPDPHAPQHADYGQQGYGEAAQQPGYGSYYDEAGQGQPVLERGSHDRPAFGQGQQHQYGQYDPSPSLTDRLGHPEQRQGNPSFGAPLHPGQQDPHLDAAWPSQAGAAHDPGAYNLNNYAPSGAPEHHRPAFGEPGYVPPTGDWEFGPAGQQPGAVGMDQFGDGRGYHGQPAHDHGGAVMQQGDVYGDEHDDDFEYYDEDEEPGTGRKLIIAGALVSAIVVGGGFAYGYNTFFGGGNSGSATPPIVKAESRPAKVQPNEPGGRSFDHKDSKLLGKLGGGSAAKTETADNAADDGNNRVRSVSTLVVGRDGRLIVPEQPQGATSTTTVASASVPTSAPDAGSGDGFSPVPGMTIVGGDPQPVVVPTAPVTPPAPQVQPASLGAQNVQPVAVPPVASVATPPAAVQPKRRGKFPPLPVRSGVAKPGQTVAVASTASTVPGVATANVTPVVPRARPAAAPAAAAPAAAQPAAVAAAAPTAAAAANGYVAVLATKRSRIDALASFADLQQKYRNILGTKDPDVRRADLSSRGLGIMYRAIAGPPGSRQAAGRICNSLKSAGYSGCWVAPY
ncbi:MAG: SPOR domain-containing protein [Hyphomicrobiaceae bacterium]